MRKRKGHRQLDLPMPKNEPMAERIRERLVFDIALVNSKGSLYAGIIIKIPSASFMNPEFSIDVPELWGPLDVDLLKMSFGKKGFLKLDGQPYHEGRDAARLFGSLPEGAFVFFTTDLILDEEGWLSALEKADISAMRNVWRWSCMRHGMSPETPPHMRPGYSHDTSKAQEGEAPATLVELGRFRSERGKAGK